MKKVITKGFLLFANISLIYKQLAVTSSSKIIFKLASRTFYRSRCLLSGRSKAIDSRFRVSRFGLRLLASNGLISGLTRAS